MRLSSVTAGAFASLTDFDARTRGGVGAGFILFRPEARRMPLRRRALLLFDTSNLTETLVLYITFVKQCDQPDAPTGVPGQGLCLDSSQPRGPPSQCSQAFAPATRSS